MNQLVLFLCDCGPELKDSAGKVGFGRQFQRLLSMFAWLWGLGPVVGCMEDKADSFREGEELGGGVLSPSMVHPSDQPA